MPKTLDVVHKEALALIDMMLETKQRPSAQICTGPPGTGKTHMYKGLIKERPDLKWIKVLQLPLYPPEDLRGVIMPRPSPEYGGRMVSEATIPTSIIPPKDEPGVLIIDDFNIAVPAQQAIIYRLIHEGVLGEHRLPEQTFIGLTGNEAGQKAVANRIPSTIINRVEYHKGVYPDADLWLRWAGTPEAGMHVFVTSFIGNLPHKLYEDPKDDASFATPRSYELMNRKLSWMAKRVGLKEAFSVERMATYVGQATAEELFVHTKYEHVFNLVRQVEQGKLKPTDPEVKKLGGDEKYILCMGVAQSPHIKTQQKYRWFIEAASWDVKDIALFGVIYTARSAPDGEAAIGPLAMEIYKTFGTEFQLAMQTKKLTAKDVSPEAVADTGKTGPAKKK